MKQNYHFWIFTLFAFLIGFSAVHAQEGTIQLKVLDTFEAFNRGYDEGAAEIPAYDPGSGIVFITNAQDDRIDAVKILADGSFEYVDSWDLAAAWPESGGPNSVAVYNGLVAVAVENDDKLARWTCDSFAERRVDPSPGGRSGLPACGARAVCAVLPVAVGDFPLRGPCVARRT